MKAWLGTPSVFIQSPEKCAGMVIRFRRIIFLMENGENSFGN